MDRARLYNCTRVELQIKIDKLRREIVRAEKRLAKAANDIEQLRRELAQAENITALRTKNIIL